MKNRPWATKLITLIFLLVPFTEYFIILYAQHKWHVRLTPNLLGTAVGLGVGSLITAVGVWKVRPWGFYVMIVFGLVIVAEDVGQIIQTPNHLNAWEFIDIALVVIGISLLNMKRVREPYFNPDIRWWERSARHAVDLPATFTFDGKAINSSLLDISATGCFTKFQNDVKEGDICIAKLTFEDIVIESPAKVMRVSQKPEGVGLRFFDTTMAAKRGLRKLIKRLTREQAKAA